MTVPLPVQSARWTEEQTDQWNAGVGLLDRADVKPLRRYPDMLVLLRVARLIGKMEVQLKRFLASDQIFKAGRTARDIERHRQHLEWLKAHPEQQLSEDRLMARGRG